MSSDTPETMRPKDRRVHRDLRRHIPPTHLPSTLIELDLEGPSAMKFHVSETMALL